jgi:hypothetical protein
MRNADVRASRVAVIADAIVNREVDGASDAVDALVAGGFGFLMMPTHEFIVDSTPIVVEYLIDDAVDYRKHGYEVIIVSAADLPQRGVWCDLLDADLERRGELPFAEFDITDVSSALA